ncbi:MAG: 50S ribosome-binding GTPase [Thermoguttaceae bacterium]|nr:50S ribosome-binding GTPase [Thermoguttaceae bacterium]MDO4858722.1 50S ribosome-binding GTPase [Thermoguttaceae bacterium]
MPANLTPTYLKAEQAYRQAQSLEEEYRCLQVMLQEIPKHKGTDHLQASLKAKIAKTKKDIELEKSSGKKSGGMSIRIPRQGAGTVVILGGTNAGKSQLMASMTNAKPKVAPHPFTTQLPQPGMMPWEDVLVQMIDTPPITPDFLEPSTYGFIRGADLALLMLDLGDDDGVENCLAVMDRLNATRTRLGKESCLDEDDIGLSYTHTFLVPNKIDVPGAMERLEVFHELADFQFEEFPISATEMTGVEELRNAIYRAMNVVRVYTKLPTSKTADMDRPFTLPVGSTLLDLAGLIHKDYIEKLKFARIWGSAVHDGTPMKGDYVLNDCDICELHC